ncbi:class I SAM-dependent RNA methyltransferase [Thalassobius vesicularis]|uniref:Class I SAM-dependent RNA methyltransferase n=1 Tax=Thalassobius vesicularis TaxID=1294297 RepID=A0A4S3MAV1_9RHOB|nr:class I SAM-dependent RNA methyltransferase [Thalassobius vesicularis]THD74000.1 class I SAM-dependent RNA methyltransferase [Thalassobius vesicularis]
MTHPRFEIFLVATPGLEAPLLAEAHEAGFAGATLIPGGVTFQGGWPDVWRANLVLRGATRVLARIGEFRAFHLAQLDKRATKFDWRAVLRPDVPVRVEATSKRSKIYHAGAAAQRVEGALTTAGIPLSPEADLVLKLRIDDNLCTFSVDTSGESLHKRGHKEAVNKAPMRETMAAMFLRQCGFDGTQTVLDPMCGSGTFVIEAAEMAAGLAPGRTRDFAFQRLASYDEAAWTQMKAAVKTRQPAARFYGSDRDAGAIRMSQANAERAGVSAWTEFQTLPISDITPPAGPAGLIIGNPPYGARIGNKKPLFALYGSMGTVLKERFRGWRVAIITSDPGLAKATALPFLPKGPSIAHGGLKVDLYRTDPL